VAAQEAIERVYYSNQIGATSPFEAAMPRAVLEGKVRKYLEQTAALEVYWKTRVTDEMLQRELERMIRGTRLPEHLQELFTALNGDPFLIKECLVRAILVDRLTRNFYAFDPTLHADARQRAEDLHWQLTHGELDPWSDHPDRSVFELVQRGPETDRLKEGQREDALPDGERPARRLLSPDEFRRERTRFPIAPGRVSSVSEEREAFMIRVVLSEAPRRVRVASYVIPKRSWDLWWETAKETVQDRQVGPIASEAGIPPVVRSGPPLARGDEGSQATADDAWDNGSLDDVPDPRFRQTAVWTGTIMVVWGGECGTPLLNTGGRYDPATDTWTATSTEGAPSARSLHTAVWTGTEMVVWGGKGTGGHNYFNTGGRYDPATDTWRATSTLGAPPARDEHTAVWTGGEMVVWGGYGTSGWLGSGGRYDPVTDTWRATSIVGSPIPRAEHTAVWTGSEMVVWGGRGGQYGSPLDTGGRYDPVADTWTATSSVGAPSARNQHTAVWTGSEMVVWGGEGPTYPNTLNTGGRYDPFTDTWTPTSSIGAPSDRYVHTAVWTGNEMVVWGGMGRYDYPLNTGGRYDPATDTWTATSTAGAPSSRYDHTAVWTGSVMVVWGGAQVDSFNSGGRYDPATDAWTVTSTGEAPARRDLHTAVWTGNVMVVWGGISIGYHNYLDTGGRYDPATDAWAATSTTGAPSPRFGHKAVWTGNAMVVWGGDADSYLNTGGRYDPATDTWRATSTVGAPSERSGHTAVWTGNEMVVWGGLSFSTYTFPFLNSGGRYDPVTDTWTATSTTAAPTPRASHTAVWTGSLMVAWGGQTFVTSRSYFLNSGGRYDPVTDTWTATSTTAAPTPRASHTAVWTGSLMVAWGGYDLTYLNNGGRYDPDADIWTATSIVGAPSARAEHTAVWTGSEMVVWGGTHEQILSSGGRYILKVDAPPVASAGPDQILECTGSAEATAVLEGSGSTDSDSTAGTNDDIVSFEWSEGGAELGTGEVTSVRFPFGSHLVTLTVADRAGASSTDDMRVIVRDTTPPSLLCPADVILECQSAGRADVSLPVASALDSCQVTASVANDRTSGGADASGSYPLGTTRVTFTATDAAGNISSCATAVTVVDTTPPLISTSVSPALLWPPNHRMLDVGASVTATDACSTPAILLTSVTTSEPDDVPGGADGSTTADIQGAQVGTLDFDFQLRAERDGGGQGRAYRITYTAIDGSGNQSSASSIVFVPHDLGGSAEPLLMSAGEDATGMVLTWSPVPGASTYQVLRGNVGSLNDAGAFIDLGAVSCVQPASGTTSTQGNEDAENPPLGGAFFYLVAYNDGRDSGYGSDTATKPRVKTGGGCE
jgi:N-acetylneuraminic acid mutarotase